MKKLFLPLMTVLLLASCSVQTPLYSWGNYETTSYNYLKNADTKSTQELIETYEKMISKQKGSRKTVPPGVYADYGFILLQANRTEDAKKQFEKEVETYPESKVFVDRILKMIEK